MPIQQLLPLPNHFNPLPNPTALASMPHHTAMETLLHLKSGNIVAVDLATGLSEVGELIQPIPAPAWEMMLPNGLVRTVSGLIRLATPQEKLLYERSVNDPPASALDNAKRAREIAELVKLNVIPRQFHYCN